MRLRLRNRFPWNGKNRWHAHIHAMIETTGLIITTNARGGDEITPREAFWGIYIYT